MSIYVVLQPQDAILLQTFICIHGLELQINYNYAELNLYLRNIHVYFQLFDEDIDKKEYKDFFKELHATKEEFILRISNEVLKMVKNKTF